MMINHNKRGFTLIEILVVVAIIGILASVVLVGLGPVQKRGRDARRISDLRQVQTGLELYYNKNGAYPEVSNWEAMADAIRNENLGVRNIPTDPTSGKTYYYGSNASSYVLGAELEDANNPSLTGSLKVDTFGVNCSAETMYCVEL